MNIHVPPWLRSNGARWVLITMGAVITIGSVLLSGIDAYRSMKGRNPGQVNAGTLITQYHLKVVAIENDMIRCEKVFIVDDPKLPLGDSGVIDINTNLLSGNIPNVGEKFRLVPTTTGGYAARMTAPPPSDKTKPVVPVPKVLRPAKK